MFRYSKVVLTGIAGIGGGIYLDRSFLYHLKDANDIENSKENERDDMGTFSEQILKVFISCISIISNGICKRSHI